jgi:hypothetical protein
VSETRRAWKAIKRAERELQTAAQILRIEQVQVARRPLFDPLARSLDFVHGAAQLAANARGVLERAGLDSLPGG